MARVYQFYDELPQAENFSIMFKDGKTIKGKLFYYRINPDSIPDGLHTIDMRHDDYGSIATLEQKVLVNYYGTFIYKGDKVALEEGLVALVDFDYSYLDKDDKECEIT